MLILVGGFDGRERNGGREVARRYEGLRVCVRKGCCAER